MSSVTTTTCHAPDCDETGPAYEFRDGDYCGTDCFYRGVGVDALDELRYDHTVCATCFSTLKEIEKPPDGVSLNIKPADYPSDTQMEDVLSGYQYRTPNAEIGDKNPDDAPATKAVIDRRTICKCGQTDHTDRDPTLVRVEGGRVVMNLLRQLYRLYDEGAIDHAPSKDRLFDALRESGGDFEYATGYALRGGD